jgi:hypothetical protein
MLFLTVVSLIKEINKSLLAYTNTSKFFLEKTNTYFVKIFHNKNNELILEQKKV